MSEWQPIANAKRDGTVYIIATTYPKARYKQAFGKWVEKFNEWQSVPGAWPMKPTHFMDPPALPEDEFIAIPRLT